MKDFLRRHPLLQVLLTLICALATLGTGLASVGTWILLFTDLLSERVHEVQPACYQPEYEGRLVKMHVRELRGEGGPAQLKEYGLSYDNAVWVRSDMRPPHHMMKRGEDFHSIDGVREHIATAPRVISGVYELHFTPSQLEHVACSNPICIPPSQVTLPDSLSGRVKEVHDKYFVMQGNDNATVHLSFSYMPSPQQKNLHLFGRQRGNSIEVKSFIRGKEAFRNYEREYSFVLLSFWEHLLLALGFLMVSSGLAALAHFSGTLCSGRAVLIAAAVAIALQLVMAFIPPFFLPLP